MLDACRAVTGSDAELVWVDPEFLITHEVGEWMELPLWIADPAWKDVACELRAAPGAGGSRN